MIPYIVLIALVICSFLICKPVYSGKSQLIIDKSKKRTLRLAFLWIILLTGLRGRYVGPDTGAYISNFNRICSGNILAGDQRFEVGYRYLTKFLSNFTHDPQILLLVIAAIINILYARFIFKYSRDMLLSIILYITVGHFVFQLTGLRQALAMAICTLSIDFALERKPIWFAASIALACSFHGSAITFIPAYFLTGSHSKRTEALAVVIPILLLLFGNRLLQYAYRIGDYDRYSDGGGVDNYGGWTIIIILSLTIILTLMSRSFHGNQGITREDRFFLFLTALALGFYLIRYQNRVAERVSNYYRLSLIILLPNALDDVPGFELRSFGKFCCCVLAFFLFLHKIGGSLYLYDFLI